MTTFRASDLDALAQQGIAPQEAQRQLQLLGRPPQWTRLDRPCTSATGSCDSLSRITMRCLRFTARRQRPDALPSLFPHLERRRGCLRSCWPYRSQAQSAASEPPATVRQFVDSVERFAFYPELKRRLSSVIDPAQPQPVLEALLDAEGLDYERLPKGQLLFHRYEGDDLRTPFEEHLVEAAHYARAKDGDCRLHFTVSAEHREGFEKLLAAVGPRWAERFSARWEIGWSHQKPSTDTIAIGNDGEPFRDSTGRLIFRPGGHGALIENLADLSGDLVYIKNIDNVQPDRLREATLLWKRLLGGLLVQTEREIHQHLRALDGKSPDVTALDRAERFLRERFSMELPAVSRAGAQSRRSFIAQLLHRPLRCCGVVANTGEPGGGPFWVRGADGIDRPQIVETAQVAPGDASQQAQLKSSTHFNPVDLVCALRDLRGQPFDLQPFIDPDAVIVTEKSSGGRELKALERPGLWNGAMAGWNTLFVEVPLQTFSPVKTVLDLLRDEHQGDPLS